MVKAAVFFGSRLFRAQAEKLFPASGFPALYDDREADEPKAINLYLLQDLLETRLREQAVYHVQAVSREHVASGDRLDAVVTDHIPADLARLVTQLTLGSVADKESAVAKVVRDIVVRQIDFESEEELHPAFEPSLLSAATDNDGGCLLVGLELVTVDCHYTGSAQVPDLREDSVVGIVNRFLSDGPPLGSLPRALYLYCDAEK